MFIVLINEGRLYLENCLFVEIFNLFKFLRFKLLFLFKINKFVVLWNFLGRILLWFNEFKIMLILLLEILVLVFLFIVKDKKYDISVVNVVYIFNFLFNYNYFFCKR